MIFDQLNPFTYRIPHETKLKNFAKRNNLIYYHETFYNIDSLMIRKLSSTYSYKKHCVFELCNCNLQRHKDAGGARASPEFGGSEK